MSKIKICHITEATSGGVWTHLKQLAQFLDPTEFEQHFILSSKKNHSLIYIKNFYGHPVKIVDIERNIKPWNDLLSTVNTYSILKQNHFDIVHCHSSKAGAVGRLAAKFANIPNILYTPHAFSFLNNNSISRFFYSAVEKILSRWTKKIICVSEGELEISLLAGFPKEKMICIPNGVEVTDLQMNQVDKASFYKINNLRENNFIIGFVGRMEKQKDPLVLLKAVPELPANIKVCFVGDGTLMELMKKQAELLHVQDRIIFLGDQDNVLSLLPIFDLFVSTSRWEGLPYSVLEAIGNCIPVILTDIHGHRELVKHKEGGLLYKVGEVEELVIQIMYAINNYEDMKRMAVISKKKMMKKYTIEKMVEKYQLLYKEMK